MTSLRGSSAEGRDVTVFWDYCVVNNTPLCDDCVAGMRAMGWVVDDVTDGAEKPCSRWAGIGGKCGRPGRMRILPVARQHQRDVIVTRDQYFRLKQEAGKQWRR